MNASQLSRILLVTFTAVLSSPTAMAGPGVYLENDVFLKQTFDTQPPKTQKLWLSKETQAQAAKILSHRYTSLRVSYWRKNGRCAFILEEIGKEKPITVGIVVENGKIQSVQILAFREVRGYEVRTPAFTKQFLGAILSPKHKLDRGIDGITGATMSVRAVTKVTRLALLLYEQTKDAQSS